MPQALRLTDRTKFKIAQIVDSPIEDIQALMEYYSDGIIRPYILLETSVFHPDHGWQSLTDQHFHSAWSFTDEEDPCMFKDVTPK